MNGTEKEALPGMTPPDGMYFVLDEHHNPVQERDLRKWAGWMVENRDKLRRVARTTVNGVWVSTVFLGLNHSFGGGFPVLFETMTFLADGAEDTEERRKFVDRQWRYHSWGRAVLGHDNVVAWIEGRAGEPE